MKPLSGKSPIAFSKEQISALYKLLKESSDKDWNEEDPGELGVALLKERGVRDVSLRLSLVFGVAASMAARVASECTFEDFEAFLLKGEAPPIKLSRDEMEMLKGGLNLDSTEGRYIVSTAIGTSVHAALVKLKVPPVGRLAVFGSMLLCERLLGKKSK